MAWLLLIPLALVLLIVFACFSVGAAADNDPTSIFPPAGDD